MKVFRLNDYEWWLAPTLQEAVDCCCRECGLCEEEAVQDPVELTSDELERLIFRDDATGDRWSFAEELERRLARGATCELFAATEF